MALGKNINVKKDSGSKKTDQKKAATKGKIEKKKLISKRTQTKKKKAKPDANTPLVRYITEESQKRKKALRERYLQEIKEAKGTIKQFIVFNIGSDEFAIDIALIKKVVPFSSIAKIPNTPNHIIGATTVRGQTITAIDLESRFTQKANANYQFTISLKNTKQRVGLLVNQLPMTLKVEGEKIDGNVSGLESVIEDETYVKGIIKYHDRLIFYLDIDELIEGDKAIVVPNELGGESK